MINLIIFQELQGVLWLFEARKHEKSDQQSSDIVQKNKTNDLLGLFQNSTYFGLNHELGL